MTLQEVLNADHRTIMRWLGQGWSWWTEELAAMAPRRRRGLGLMAELPADDAPPRLTRDGRLVAPGTGAQAAIVVLPPGAVLVRDLQLPPLSLAQIRQVLAGEIDRLTPFAPEAVLFDVEATGRDAATGRRAVTLGVVPRAAAEAALARARGHGLTPQALSAAGAEGGARFDFLAVLEAERGEGRRPGRAVWWWAAVALAFAANLGLLIFKDMRDVATLRETVESQQPAVAAASQLRRRVEAETKAREAWLARRDRQEPLAVIETVTAALPSGAWVQRLGWNGRAVRLAGYRQDDADVLKALRAAPGLTNVRSSTGDIPAKLEAGQPFDITAEPK